MPSKGRPETLGFGNLPEDDPRLVRYREHKIRTSLQRHVGESPTDPAVIEHLVRRARALGVVVFLKAELERLPDMSRALIESEHKRLCERGGR